MSAEITTRMGVLWRGETMLNATEADRVAQEAGFPFAPEYVAHLEAGGGDLPVSLAPVVMTEPVNAKSWLRPSALPKLALCGHYRGEAGSSVFAARGTQMDAEFREGFDEDEDDEEMGSEASVEASEQAIAAPLRAALRHQNTKLNPEDREAIQWAENTAKLLADGKPLEASEENLVVEVMGMTGTADLLCVEGQWSADLKSGMERNYREQMAAYALGFMDKYFCEEWTVYLFFCDIPKLETIRFSREEAEQIVKDVLLKAEGAQPPEPNEYCGWCARRFECPARKESLGIIPLEGMTTLSLEGLPSATLRDFAITVRTVKDFDKEARRILKERKVNGDATPGVTLSHRKGSRKLPVEKLVPLFGKLQAHEVLAPFGTISEAKAATLFEAAKLEFPTADIVQSPGSSSVRLTKPKA